MSVDYVAECRVVDHRMAKKKIVYRIRRLSYNPVT